jgi:hypothetical protein
MFKSLSLQKNKLMMLALAALLTVLNDRDATQNRVDAETALP